MRQLSTKESCVLGMLAKTGKIDWQRVHANTAPSRDSAARAGRRGVAMAEPAFYRCGSCLHTWQRTEWKTSLNPPPVCPRCGSTEQRTDQEREDAYVREVYGPMASIFVGAINKRAGE